MTWKLLQTEKAFNLQTSNIYTLVNAIEHKTNKIELGKLLSKNGIKIVEIRSTNTYSKIKTKGQKRNKISVKRPKKWFVNTAPSSIITDEILANLK